VVPPHAQPAAEPHGTDDVDAFLVREIRRGDQRAWKQLIDRYHGRLAAFARTRIRNAAEVDDVVQDAFVGFLTSLSHFDETRPLETYLFSILRYKIGEALSRGKRTAGVGRGFDDSQDGSDAAIGATHETPSGVAQQHELNRRQEELLASMLRRLVQELRDRDKLDDVQVLELLFFMGLRNKEAADRLGRGPAPPGLSRRDSRHAGRRGRARPIGAFGRGDDFARLARTPADLPEAEHAGGLPARPAG
jgi:RNA polymerase sigma-70 factor (ECF subfamily)